MKVATNVAIVAMLVTGGASFRVRPARKNKEVANKEVARSVGSPGMVDGLYTYGSPGTAKPGLKNARSGSGGCFPGLRFWNIKKTWYGNQVDIVVPLAGVAGFKHPWMDGGQLDIATDKVNVMKCSNESQVWGRGVSKAYLHDKELYIDQTSSFDRLIKNVSHVGMRKSYMQDRLDVARRVAEYGWNLVDTAVETGEGSLQGGYQVSHLIQNPDNLECILTFQGSSSAGDWFANLDAGTGDFCGLNEKVHKGFRDHLRRITSCDIFQSTIRPALPSCSKLYVTGHSLGGALAELFSACVARVPPPSDRNFGDYSNMGWTTGVPKRLPCVLDSQ